MLFKICYSTIDQYLNGRSMKSTISRLTVQLAQHRIWYMTLGSDGLHTLTVTVRFSVDVAWL